MSFSKLKLNWKYALGEITLIFVGISLAVGFDNWNQDRRKYESQRLILEEIRTDLYQDTVLINRVMSATGKLMNSVDFLTDHLSNKRPYTDEVGSRLANVLTFPRAPFISAGYQTLKSTDITLIRNQQLRRELVEYYEFMHPFLAQTMGDVEFEFKTYWTPWILEHVIEFRYSQMAEPIDYNTLKDDPLLVRNLKISRDNNQGLYGNLQRAETDVRDLIIKIGAELSKLR